MEKILLVINAHRPDSAAIDFACSMASFVQSKLTSLFIENLFFEDIPEGTADRLSSPKTFKENTHTTVKTDTEQAVRLFKQQCRSRKVEPEVYIDKGEPIQEVIYESRFADLLMIDPAINFFNREEDLPSHFVKEALAKAECPILLIPEKLQEVEEIVFCYDGGVSSVFAIKQFTYLLPEFSSRKVMLLKVNKYGKEEFNEADRRMMEWLRAHYPSVYYHALKGDVEDELFSYFFMKRNKMIVMGAYGRSLLSNFFKKSNADVLIRTVDLPVFITHH